MPPLLILLSKAGPLTFLLLTNSLTNLEPPQLEVSNRSCQLAPQRGHAPFLTRRLFDSISSIGSESLSRTNSRWQKETANNQQSESIPRKLWTC